MRQELKERAAFAGRPIFFVFHSVAYSIGMLIPVIFLYKSNA